MILNRLSSHPYHNRLSQNPHSAQALYLHPPPSRADPRPPNPDYSISSNLAPSPPTKTRATTLSARTTAHAFLLTSPKAASQHVKYTSPSPHSNLATPVSPPAPPLLASARARRTARQLSGTNFSGATTCASAHESTARSFSPSVASAATSPNRGPHPRPIPLAQQRSRASSAEPPAQDLSMRVSVS